MKSLAIGNQYCFREKTNEVSITQYVDNRNSCRKSVNIGLKFTSTRDGDLMQPLRSLYHCKIKNKT